MVTICTQSVKMVAMDKSRASRSRTYEFPPQDEWRIWMYFLKAYKAVVERVDKDLRAASHLTLAEFELLHLVIRAHGRIRFIDLARVTLLSQSRISRQIDALQAKGFLYREITASDRRATFAVLTPAGRDAYDGAFQPFLQAYHEEFAGLIPAGDLKPFGEVLLSLLKEPDYSARVTAVMDAARAANAPAGRRKASKGHGGRSRRAA